MMARFTHRFSLVPALLLVGLLSACGGGGGGGTASGTTTVSGAVSLSSLAGSPGFFEKIARFFSLSRATTPDGFKVALYNADHPEWLHPVAYVLTNGSGGYTLDTLANATNNFNAYTDGGAIPSGKYTIVADKLDALNGRLYVAVQAYVKTFDGAVTGNDLVAIDSGVIPKVVTMFGLPENSYGTFGSSVDGIHEIPQNGAIQVTFNTPMARLTVQSAISIKQGGNDVSGAWKISADLLSATFKPTSDLTPTSVYTVTVVGGGAVGSAKNLYGQSIPGTVNGTFTATVADTTPPNASRCGAATGVSIAAPIRIKSNELLDLNTFVIASTPGIGDKPAVIYRGNITGCTDVDYPFGYEIIPATALALDTDYAITVSGAKDLAGIALATLNANFKTESAHATGTVTVTSIDPADTASGVALNKIITLEFSGLIQAGSVTLSTLTISPSITGTIIVNNNMVAFTPSSVTTPANPLEPGTTYTVTATNGILDIAGAPITQAQWTFSTVPRVTVSTVNPDDATTNVAVNQTITATFSGAINPASVTGATFTISPSVSGVNVTANSTTATMTHTGAFARNTPYTVNLTSGVLGANGKAITPKTWTFTTVPPAYVASTSPGSGAVGVPIATAVDITFSEPINPASVVAGTITMNVTAGAAVSGTISNVTGTTARFTPSAPLAYSTGYDVNVTSAITDPNGAAIAPTTWSFTTGTVPLASEGKWDLTTTSWDGTATGTGGSSNWAP